MRDLACARAWWLALGAILVCGLAPAPADAQDPGADRQGSARKLIESITVTATKKSAAEELQDVPVSVTAYSGEQIDALQVRDLEGLSFSMPNVALDSVGTTKGVANFMVRGLGINSSIPSIDPTVGVFLDGVYLGVNQGVVVDTFDLEAVEVLRGPQGLLFGRNVTGGAVLLRSKRPSDQFEASARAAIETGNEKLFAAAVSGPLIDEVLKARISVQFRKDRGWFDNEVVGSDDPIEEETFLIRPSFTFTPSENLEFHLAYEHGDTDADGPAAQNRSFFDGFDFANDEKGLSDLEWDHVSFETGWYVPFGDGGKITNIVGYRQVDQEAYSDIDATASFLFHAASLLDQDQWSNELRYSGRFNDSFDVTVGAYYFTQDIVYRERRLIPPSGLDSTFGGDQETETWGVFGQTDIDLSDAFTLILGLRYTYEDKEVDVATIGVPSPCTFATRGCTTFDFVDDDDWSSVTPKIGFQWWTGDSTQVYGHYTKGFRSGGYNLRNTHPSFGPGPFDEEEQDSFELGLKTTLSDGRVRLGLAGFFNQMDDMQREINEPGPFGVSQVTRNTADAEIFGFEGEFTALVTDSLALRGSLGYTHGEYKRVTFDLNGDGTVDGDDRQLDIPRLTRWSASFGVTHDLVVGDTGILTSQANWSYRDDSKYTDNNVGVLSSGSLLFASLSLALFDSPLTFTAYGKNLLDERFEGGDTITPFGTFTPLKEGRVYGFEVRADF